MNTDNQARRLVQNASKLPFEITFNDIKNIDNKKVPANANLEFNAGLYLSAVRPALDVIQREWSSVINNVKLTCDTVSHRTDESGQHRVQTKLIFLLCSDGRISKAVMHLYHTDNKIQIQSSTIIQGKSCVEWIVDFFLKPLLDSHLSQNQESISSINNYILSSHNKCCSSCNGKIDPKAHQPRDQLLCCKKCGRGFHKKCTNRKQSKANWHRDPWFCEHCILGQNTGRDPIPGTSNQSSTLHHAPPALDYNNHSQSQAKDLVILDAEPEILLNTNDNNAQPNSAATISSLGQPTSQQALMHILPDTLSPVTPALATTPAAGSSTQSPSQFFLQSVLPQDVPETQALDLAPHGSSQSSTQAPPQRENQNIQPDTQSAQQTQIRPSRNSRQRGTNVGTTDPQYEFLQTALDTCRSTITQQETEIKKLKESLNIRTKRVMQLESQVGEAANYISSRKPPDKDSTGFTDINKLGEKIDLLISKLHAPNITINNNQNPNSNQQYHREQIDQSSQTLSNCSTCNTDIHRENNLEAHTDSTHGLRTKDRTCTECKEINCSCSQLTTLRDNTRRNLGNIHTCEHCNVSFISASILLEHTETLHADSFHACEKCDYKCRTETHLRDHYESFHGLLDSATESNL